MSKFYLFKQNSDNPIKIITFFVLRLLTIQIISNIFKQTLKSPIKTLNFLSELLAITDVVMVVCL
jgi:hypothetical protein